MERKLVFVALLAILVSGIGTVSAVRAQPDPSKAEFHLAIHFADTTSGSQATLSDRVIGYDSRASDTASSYDAGAYGEDLDYPGGLGAGGNDFWFMRPDGSNTRIYIRHKPVEDSFALSFPMGLSFETYPGSIYWDPSQIPAVIKGIWIRPAESQTPLVDMKDTNIFTETDAFQAGIWGNLVVTVFYNMQPRYIPAAVLPGTGNASGSLILDATAYPNPMPGSGTLAVTLSEPATVTVTGYDVAGRKMLEIRRGMAAGENMLDISRDLMAVHGAVLLRIVAERGDRASTRSVMLVRE